MTFEFSDVICKFQRTVFSLDSKHQFIHVINTPVTLLPWKLHIKHKTQIPHHITRQSSPSLTVTEYANISSNHSLTTPS